MATSSLAKYLESESSFYSLVEYEETGELHLYKARKNSSGECFLACAKNIALCGDESVKPNSVHIFDCKAKKDAKTVKEKEKRATQKIVIDADDVYFMLYLEVL